MMLRDRVADELEGLLRRSGLDSPWSDRTDASTRWLHGDGTLYDIDRMHLHDELVRQRRAASPAAARGHQLAAVVTAGPPGAGKTTVVARDPALARFCGVDADDFKDALLVDAQLQGHLERWTSMTLCDGRPVAPRELAGFVHAESTAVADAMREACLVDGEDILIHGTLSSTDYVDQLLAELDEFGYGRLVIYDVEVPAGQAVERALQRWWSVRTSGRDALGGRFLPPDAIRGYYPSGAGRSKTAANAVALRDRAQDLGWNVELNVVSP